MNANNVLPGLVLLSLCGICAAMAVQPPNSPPGPSVTLHSTGEPPRTALRYHLSPDQVERWHMVMDMQMTLALGQAAPSTSSMPPIHVPFSVRVTRVSPTAGADLLINFSTFEVDAQGQLSAQTLTNLRKKLESLNDFSCTSSMTVRGRLSNMQCNLPSGNKEASQVLQQIQNNVLNNAVVLPDVAVGIGAKWEIESRGSLTDKLRFDQRVQYELVNLRDQIATIRVAITQTAPQQSYPVPEESGVPTVATLTHYSAQGGGTLSLDLNKTLPSSRTTSTVVQHTIIAQDKAEVKSGFPMKSEVKLKLRVSPQQ